MSRYPTGGIRDIEAYKKDDLELFDQLEQSYLYKDEDKGVEKAAIRHRRLPFPTVNEFMKLDKQIYCDQNGMLYSMVDDTNALLRVEIADTKRTNQILLYWARPKKKYRACTDAKVYKGASVPLIEPSNEHILWFESSLFKKDYVPQPDSVLYLEPIDYLTVPGERARKRKSEDERGFYIHVNSVGPYCKKPGASGYLKAKILSSHPELILSSAAWC